MRSSKQARDALACGKRRYLSTCGYSRLAEPGKDLADVQDSERGNGRRVHFRRTQRHAGDRVQALADLWQARNRPAGLNFGGCFAYALPKVSGELLLFATGTSLKGQGNEDRGQGPLSKGGDLGHIGAGDPGVPQVAHGEGLIEPGEVDFGVFPGAGDGGPWHRIGQGHHDLSLASIVQGNGTCHGLGFANSAVNSGGVLDANTSRLSSGTFP